MSKKNGFGKVLLWSCIGAIVGYSIPKTYGMLQSFEDIYGISMIWILMPLLFVAALFLYIKSITQFKNMNRKQLAQDADIIYQVTQHNKASSNIVNAYNLLFLSICISLTLLTEPSIQNIIILVAYSLLSVILITLISKHNRRVLAAFPTLTNNNVSINYGDTQLMENVINAIDEGERLVMLHSLSKTYQIMIVMLSFLLIVLGLYQARTGENQLLGMVGITAILIYSTIVYYKKNEEFNK